MASLNYSHGRKKDVRKVRAPFQSICDTQLERAKTGTFLRRIQHVPSKYC